MIANTAWPDNAETHSKTANAGFDDVLIKPTSIYQILKAMPARRWPIGLMTAHSATGIYCRSGEMLGFVRTLPSHPHVAFAQRNRFTSHSRLINSIKRPSRDSSCSGTAERASHWRARASAVIFSLRTRFTARHRATPPHGAQACAGPVSITISRPRSPASAVFSYAQRGQWAIRSVCGYRP